MNTEQKLFELEAKIEAIYKSVEQTRKILLWTGIVTVAMIVLPVIGLLFAIPTFISQFQQLSTGVGF
jgi:hypothetical protein